MKPDLKNMSRKQLLKLQSDIEKALEKLADTEKRAALEAAEKAAKAHGYSLKDLTGVKPARSTAAKSPAKKPAANAKDGRAKVAPKFRNPGNPEQTWSGRGRSPTSG